MLTRHWTALLLTLVTAVSLGGGAAGALGWKDAGLSLLFPTVLLIVQETINRRRPGPQRG